MESKGLSNCQNPEEDSDACTKTFVLQKTESRCLIMQDLTAAIDTSGKRIGNLADPMNPKNFVTKRYLEAKQKELNAQLLTLTEEFNAFNHSFKAFTIDTAIRVISVSTYNQYLDAMKVHIANLQEKRHESGDKMCYVVATGRMKKGGLEEIKFIECTSEQLKPEICLTYTMVMKFEVHLSFTAPVTSVYVRFKAKRKGGACKGYQDP